MSAGLVDALKSAFRVWVFTTIGLFLPGMLGWINDVTKWAGEKGAPPFPDPSNLMYLFIAAITAAFPAAVAGLVRFAENASGHTLAGPRAAGPHTVPVTNPGDRGQGGILYVLLVAIAAVVLFILLVRLVG